MLAGGEIVAEDNRLRLPTRPKLQHLNRVAQVKVEDLVGRQFVHLGERAGLEQVIDRRPGMPFAALQLYAEFRGVCAAKKTALHGMGAQLEQVFDLFGGHLEILRPIWNVTITKTAAKMGCMIVLMYSAPWCRDCRETKRYLDAHRIAFTEIDIEAVPGASDEVLNHVGKRAIPQLVLDGEWFQPYRPGRGILYDELDEKFGIKTRL